MDRPLENSSAADSRDGGVSDHATHADVTASGESRGTGASADGDVAAR